MEKGRVVSLEDLEHFRQYLHEESRGVLTIEKYLHGAKELIEWLAGRPVTRESTADYRNYLLKSGLSSSTINGRIAAANAFFAGEKLDGLHIKTVKRQHRVFRNENKELTRKEFERLVAAAKRLNKGRTALILETICSTGMRVSEVEFVTVESLKEKEIRIYLKGKERVILLTKQLRRKLKKYAKKHGILSGAIFLSKSGRKLSRQQIWADMKALCGEAGVNPKKVFPHNLRHLFARCFYERTHDAAKLSDLLGHSSISTTRIYLVSAGKEHRKELEKLGLVS